MIVIPQNIFGLSNKKILMRGRMSRVGEWEGTYRILVGKPAVKRPLGRDNRVQEDNIKMDLKEIRWAGVDWIDLAWDRDFQ